MDYRGLFGGENFGWVGLIATLLAVTALVGLRRRGRRLRLGFLLIMAAVSYVLAMGAATPLYHVVYDVVPGMHDFRFPVRWLYPMSIALAALAALGVDELRARFTPSPRERRMGLSAACVGAAVALAVASDLLLGRAWAEHRHLLYASLIALGLAATGVAAGIRGWLPRPAAAALIPLAVAVELFAGAQPFSWNRPAPDVYSASPSIPMYVSAHGGGRVLPVSANTDYTSSIRQMSANTPLLSGAISASGFGGNWPAARSAHIERDILSPLRADDPNALAKGGLLRLLGARYVVADAGQARLAADPELSLVARDGGFALYELKQPGARAWTACGATFVGSESAALAAVTAPGFEVDQVYLEGAAVGSGEAGACGSASVGGETPDHVQVDVTMSRDGWLVLADSWDGGWRARVGESPAEIRHADYFFRAVRVPAGTHRVSFDYSPASVQWGALLSLGSLAALCVGLALPLCWRRIHPDKQRANIFGR